uniref:Uncharacterized protein n=1 Tax=Arundo donax TaxID=35708 RepID=A0A0A9HE65_ARUDO
MSAYSVGFLRANKFLCLTNFLFQVDTCHINNAFLSALFFFSHRFCRKSIC